MAQPFKICVCGGGKSAHVMALIAASQKDVEIVVNVLALFEDEAEKWNKAIEKNEMVLSIKDKDGNSKVFKGKPSLVTKQPQEAVSECVLIIFTVAAYAHEDYIKAIAPYLDKKMVIVGFPGHCGFEYMCKSYLGEDLREQITIMSFELSPWVCQLVECGQTVEVTRIAKNLRGSILRGKAIPRKPALMSLQMTLGHDPMLQQVKHFVELFFTTYSFVNPAIMYGKWKDWKGDPQDTAPLFYEDVSETTVQLIVDCNKEYQAVAHALSSVKPEVDLTEIPDYFVWTVEYYKQEIEDGTSLLRALQTNTIYKGVVHEMIKEKRKFIPNFKCRYLSEDIPYGLVVVRGIAEILGIETPLCNMLIEWSQDKLGKKYLVNGKLLGDHVKESRAPQRFGFTTIEEFLAGVQHSN